MRAIVTFFVKYPIWANAIIGVVMIVGALSYVFGIKKSFFPEAQPKLITVSVVFPGASPEEVEEGVTIKIEEAIKGIVGIVEVSSVSRENSASVTIETSTDYELDDITTEVKNAVDRINSFPESAEKPVVVKQKSTTFAVFMGVKGNVPLEDLKTTAEKVENDFLNSSLISQVRLSGFPEIEIAIEVSEADLRRYGLTFSQVAGAVRANNRDVSGGSIKTDAEEIKIRANSKEFDPARIEQIIVRANPDGTKVLLRDIATVEKKFADAPNKLYSNGERAVRISVSKLPEEDITKIANYVMNYVEEFNTKNSTVQLFTYFNANEVLEDRLNLLKKNFGIGLLLVLLVLGLFLSLRLSFWVAFGIPLSFLAMFIVGDLAGITINLLSLFGMLLVVGILVDDGIVIAENIYTHFQRGKDPKKAAIDGTMEMIPSVFTSVMTTIVAFLPLLYLDNNGFTRETGIVVIACLGFSMVEAFFVLPAHLASQKILSKKEHRNWYSKFRGFMEGAIETLRYKVYARALKFLIDWKWVSFAVPLMFIFITIGMFRGGFVKSSFYPIPPADDLNMNLQLKPGTRENVTEAYLVAFQDSVWAVHREIQEAYAFEDSIITTIDLAVGANSSRQTGSHLGYLNINFENLEEKNIAPFEVSRRIRAKIGDVPEAESFTIGNVNYFGKPISISLKSSNIENLELAKDDLKSALSEITVVKEITDNASIGQREIELELKPLAYLLGMTQQDITTQIRQGFFGEEVQRLQIGSDEVKVWVRYPKEDRLSITQLEEMKVKMSDGAEYPLTALTDYTIGRGVININHFNGKREVRVDAELGSKDASLPDILEKISADILPPILAKYPGLEYSYEGQSSRGAREFGSLAQVMPIIFLLLLLFITLNFRSFYQTVLIMFLIPLGVICAMFGHWIEGVVFYYTISGYGVLALTGVLVNDAVVMLDRFNKNIKEGMKIEEAAHKAGVARFRAIILTSLTTVAGLYPLILETSFQAQLLIPMAVSLAWGVLLGTLFILFFFPIIILVFNDVRLGIYQLFRLLFGKKEHLTREDVEPAMIELKRELEFK